MSNVIGVLRLIGKLRFLPCGNFLPIFILPLMLLTATVNVWWGMLMLISMITIVLYLQRFCLRYYTALTYFFYIWSLTSVVVIHVMFQFWVVPFLDIIIEENVLAVILIVAANIFMYFTISINPRNKHVKECLLGAGEEQCSDVCPHYCSPCQTTVPEQDMHCVWLACCIGIHNRMVFLTFTLFANAALLYIANLTLTSVCHNYRLIFSILMPDDCSEVYENIRMSGPFVVGIYSLLLSLLLFYYMFYMVLIISIGMTGKQFSALPLSSKLLLGIGERKPKNLGFFRNWRRTLCYNFKRERSSRN